MLLTKSGKKLAEVIKKAIADLVITQAELEEIMNLTHDDGVVDPHERVLLRELKNLLENNTLQKMP